MNKSINVLNKHVVIVSCFIFCDSCVNKTKDNNLKIEKPDLYNRVFVMQPVSSPAAETDADTSVFGRYHDLGVVISRVDSSTKKFDSSVQFTTGFRVQKIINIDQDYISYLDKKTDSSYLGEIVTNSYPVATLNFGTIKFIQKYNKRILGFGNAIVYEYRITAPPSQAYSRLYLVLSTVRDQYASSYSGFSFLADDIKWYQKKDKTNSELFSLVFGLEPDETFEALMNYDSARFIPIAHSKVSE